MADEVPTQRDSIRSAMSRLYSNALDAEALVEAGHALEEAQNSVEYVGTRDGSVPEWLWMAVRAQYHAFMEIQRQHLFLMERAKR